MDNHREQLVSVSRLARSLGHIDAIWLIEQCEKGNIPHLKIRGRFFFNPDAVKAVLARMAAEGRGDVA